MGGAPTPPVARERGAISFSGSGGKKARAARTAAGTDAGVAKLVAAALQESGGEVPMIGVAPFRKVTGYNDPLEGKNGEEARELVPHGHVQ